jgi:exosome complex component RRP4
MISLFKEGDVICAEVHSLNNDHSVNLHTRSFKYGK